MISQSRLLCMLLIGVTLAPALPCRADAPPNIVFLLSDDQAWTDYGFMGHPVIRTPNLDRLAERSAVFPRGYVPTALCRPSLATLVTGLYAHQHKVTGNDPSHKLASPDSPAYAELRERLIAHLDGRPTVPRLLTEAGYRTFQAGKWWEGSYKRGGFTDGMTRGFPERGGRHGDDGLTIGRQGMKPIFNFIDESIAAKKPFFVWYAPFLPHSPHNPPERLLKRYRELNDSLPVAKYQAMCEWYDETCGSLIDFVEQRGLTNNTVFISICDNGWIQSPDSPEYAPASKQSPNEGGVRQPIIIGWPGKVKPGRYDTLVSSIDLAPTMLAAAGIAKPAEMPGINLLPHITQGVPIERDTIFGEGFAHDVADIDNPEKSLLYRWVIRGNWKLLLTYDGEVGRYAKSHPRTERRPQLFDLADDPHEKHNLAAEHPELVAELADKIANWWPVTERQCLTKWQD